MESHSWDYNVRRFLFSTSAYTVEGNLVGTAGSIAYIEGKCLSRY